MGALILDASVLIGLLDTSDTHHNAAVDDVEAADLRGDELLISPHQYIASGHTSVPHRSTGMADVLHHREDAPPLLRVDVLITV